MFNKFSLQQMCHLFWFIMVPSNLRSVWKPTGSGRSPRICEEINTTAWLYAAAWALTFWLMALVIEDCDWPKLSLMVLQFSGFQISIVNTVFDCCGVS